MESHTNQEEINESQGNVANALTELNGEQVVDMPPGNYLSDQNDINSDADNNAGKDSLDSSYSKEPRPDRQISIHQAAQLLAMKAA